MPWTKTANIKGDPGPPGPPGAPGQPYRHHQATPSATWTIPHGLGKRAMFTLTLEGDSEPVNADQSFPEPDPLNVTVVSWPAAVAGWAEL